MPKDLFLVSIHTVVVTSAYHSTNNPKTNLNTLITYIINNNIKTIWVFVSTNGDENNI